MKQILTIAFILILPCLSSAQTGFKIFFDGIPGPIWGGPYHQWFDAESMNYKLTQSGTMQLGGGSGAGKATSEDIKLTMKPSKTSDMLNYRCRGLVIPTVRIAALNHSSVMKYYDLEDVIITSYELRTDENGKLIEEIWLDFAKISAYDGPEHSNGTAFKWNFPANVPH